MRAVWASSRAHRREAGFTLPELVLAVAILGLVMAPLTAGIIIFLRSFDDTEDRMVASHDAQLVSVYLPGDVQSATSVDTSGIGACSGQPSVLRLGWTAT